MSRSIANSVNISLAQETEKYPLLWDASLEIYRRADLKPAAWEEVASAVNKRHNTTVFTAESAKKKFKDLKENFAKNFRKVRESHNKCCGSGRDDTYQPTWPVYKYLMHLIKAYAQAQSVSNIPTGSGVEDSQTTMYFDETLQEYCLVPDDNSFNLEDCQSPTLQESTVSKVIVPLGPASDPLPKSSGTIHIPSKSTSNPQSPDTDLFRSFATPSGCGLASASPESVLSPGITMRSSSPAVKRPADSEVFFNRKGEAKKSPVGFLQKAVKVLEKIADDPVPKFTAPAFSEVQLDGFSMFVCQRLKEMEKDARKACENEIMDVLRKY